MIDPRVFRKEAGKNLARKRKEAGYTQEQAAQLVGYSVWSWRAWEYGQRKMPADVATRFAAHVKPRIEQVHTDYRYISGSLSLAF